MKICFEWDVDETERRQAPAEEERHTLNIPLTREEWFDFCDNLKECGFVRVRYTKARGGDEDLRTYYPRKNSVYQKEVSSLRCLKKNVVQEDF